MVKVIGVETRKNSLGESFTVLVIQGGLEMVQSKETGKFYATVRKTSVPSTFDEVTARSFIGSQLPGKIERTPCEPYDYVTQDSEVIKLDFTYSYNPSPNIADVVIGEAALAV